MVWFGFFHFCFSASLPCLSLFWGFVLLLLFCFVFFFWCSLFHLTSDLARFGAQFRSCVTVHPPHPPSQKDILTFTYFPKLTHRLHTPNKSILHLPQLERHMAHSSPENVQAVVSVPCPQWLEESGPRFSYLSLSVCVVSYL